MRFDVIDCKMVFPTSNIVFGFVLGNCNKSSIKMTSIPNTAEEERVFRGLASWEVGGVELRLCRVMTDIVVLGNVGAAAITCISQRATS